MAPRAPILALSAVAAVAAAQAAILRVGRTWGASYAEAAQPLPGDELVPNPASQATMAITIEAPPEAVWPWLVQMGVDRAGLYTHTWVENGLLHLKVKNADRIVPEWQELRVGDRISFVPEGYRTPPFGPRVIAIEPNRSLVCILGDDPSTCLGTWQFVLQPRGQSTRLLFRGRTSASRPIGFKLIDLILEPGYLYMDVGMLHGLKTRAERAVRRSIDGAPPATSDGRAITALVAVASQQGSTRQIATAIAAELRTKGIAAEVRDARDVKDLSGYDAVVLGSAIHTHHWLEDARRFVERHRAALKTRPVWLFSSGMLAIDTNTPWAADYPQGIVQIVMETGAREHRIFTGRREMPEPKFLWHLIAHGFARAYHVHMTIGDYREWDAIRTWADEVGAALEAEARYAAA